MNWLLSCQDPDQRGTWKILKALPSLAPWETINDIPTAEQNWIIAQIALDNQIIPCKACNTLQSGGYFCVKCGRELMPKQFKDDDYVCPTCNYYHDEFDKFCRNCGYDIQNDGYFTYYKKIISAQDDSKKILDIRDEIKKRIEPLSEKAKKFLARNPMENRVIIENMFQNDPEFIKQSQDEINAIAKKAELDWMEAQGGDVSVVDMDVELYFGGQNAGKEN